jgi:DNA polymerase I-like protein with 3'-5' exonuclease and polymerase domains
MIQTLNELIDKLDSFDVTKRIYMDCETTSFDDEVPAFKPYFGHRATMIILGQLGKPTFAIPLRHRTEAHLCIERLDDAKQIISEWAEKIQILANLNLKFDLHFTGVDGIEFPNARHEDTGVLARLVYNEHRSYSLENLCKYYNVTQKEASAVKAWLAEHPECKDYGRIPFSILEPYGIADVDSDMDLHVTLLSKLPDETKPVWDVECDLLPILYESEKDGIQVDKDFLLKKKLELLTSMLTKARVINQATGIENPSSGDQYGAYFQSLGIQSNKLTENKNPSWNKDVLEYISSLGQDVPHKMAKLLAQYGKEENAESTFCTGWLKHMDKNNIIHANVRQTGTVSTRSSSAEPNIQNIPKWLMEGIIIEPGHVGIAWDLSQIEYRLFAHYANDPEIIAKYAANPKIDYHQILADKLGIPRNPTKRINFGILYGMGKGKTTATLRNEIIDNDSATLREHLYATYFDPTAEVPVEPDIIPQDVLVIIADTILKEYHNQNPLIKQMQNMIKGLLRQRGYVRSYYGMHFYLDVDHAYVGLNRVIQGTAATLFKKKIVELFHRLREIGNRARLKLQVHDAVYASVPLEQANEYIREAHRIITDCPFRVPVRMDFELALYNWKNKIKISHNTDVIQDIGKLCFAK